MYLILFIIFFINKAYFKMIGMFMDNLRCQTCEMIYNMILSAYFVKVMCIYNQKGDPSSKTPDSGFRYCSRVKTPALGIVGLNMVNDFEVR